MQKGWQFIILLFLFAATGWLSWNPQVAFAKITEIRFAAAPSSLAPTTDTVAKFAAEVKARLGLRVSLLDKALLPPSHYLDALQKGMTDLAVLSPQHLTRFKDQPGVSLDQPFLFDGQKNLIAYQHSDFGEVILGSLRRIGLIGLGFWNNGFTLLASKTPIYSVSDLKGKKILNYGPKYATAGLNTFGAFTVPVPRGEVSHALERGLSDSAEVRADLAPEILGAHGFYVADLPFRASVGIVAASASFWNKLTEREKQTLAAIVDETSEKANEKESQLLKSTVAELPLTGIKTTEIKPSARAKFVETAFRSVSENNPAFSDYPPKLGLQEISYRRRLATRSVVPLLHWSQTSDPCPPTDGPRDIFFVTNRARENSRDARFAIGSNRATRLHYGTATISFDVNRPIGGAGERFFHWKGLSFAPSSTDFWRALSFSITCTERRELFIFVHGYKNTFEDSVRTTASITSDLKLRGPVIAFSWPTEGSALDYAKDRDSALFSVDSFTRFLREVSSKKGIRDVRIVSHSMGSRVVTFGLKQFVQNLEGGAPRPRFSNLVFGAPEIDRDLFRQGMPILARLFGRITLYASANDRALQIARQVNSGAPRAGEIGSDGILLLDTVDSVDASAVDTSMFGFRHAYIAQRTPVLLDLFELLRNNSAPDDRFALERVKEGRRIFWRFRMHQ